MSDKSLIEWTDATWGPTVGCTKVSPGCDHCYAETFVNRFAGKSPAFPNRFDTVVLRPQFLDLPLRWRRPRRIFVNSLSDLFHADVPDEYLAKVFAVMALAGQHTFQVLTKRHARMRSLLADDAFRREVDRAAGDLLPPLRPPAQPRHLDFDRGGVVWPIPNVWLGVSVEDQHWADIRVPALLDTPAAVRFLSCEPLLGPVDITFNRCREHDTAGGFCTFSCPLRTRIDWVIVGGESGTGARPMDRKWVERIRDDCGDSNTAFFFKQWGQHDENGVRCRSKHDAGRELDGRTHDGYPDAVMSA